METPSKTVELLTELCRLGFDDEAFWRIHHWREDNRRENILHHARYCQEHQSFRTEPNRLVQRRLRLIRDAYRQGGFSSDRSEVFQWLAEAAYAEIPPSQKDS